MPRRKRSLSPNFKSMDDDYDDDLSSTDSRTGNNNNQPPIQRNAANARERARMRVLSSAFCRLKTKLPSIPSDTKLSKLDTLRFATFYIKRLNSELNGEQTSDYNQQQTNDHNYQQHSNSWPLSFQNMLNNKYYNNIDTIMKHYTSSASSTSSLESSPTHNNNNSSSVNLNPSSSQWTSAGTLSRNVLEQQAHGQQQPTSPTLQRQTNLF